jgi:hypothetical protein
MHKLALTRSAFADRLRFSRKVFRKNPNNGTAKDRFFVEKVRGGLLDFFSQSEKLLHSCAAFRSLRSREFIKRGIANLAHDNLVVVQHGKPESVSFFVMPLDFVTGQRHGQRSPQTDAGSPRLPQPASQINGFTATLSRKLLTFLIVLASIAFGVCSPSFAQSSPLPGFPPGLFDNKAARDPAPSGGSPTLTGQTSGNDGGTCSFLTTCTVSGLTLTSGYLVTVLGSHNNSGTTANISSVAGGCSGTLTAIQNPTSAANNAMVGLFAGTITGGTGCTISATASAAGTFLGLFAGAGTLNNLSSTIPGSSCNGLYPATAGTPYPCSTSITISSGGFAVGGIVDTTGSVTFTAGTMSVDSQTASTNVSGAIGNSSSAGSITPSWNAPGFNNVAVVAAAWR